MKLDKLLKQLPTGWAEEAEAMNEEDLRNVIVDSSNNINTTRLEMEDNKAFQESKEQYKNAAGPYKDAMKAQKAKIEYALYLLNEKGKL